MVTASDMSSPAADDRPPQPQRHQPAGDARGEREPGATTLGWRLTATPGMRSPRARGARLYPNSRELGRKRKKPIRTPRSADSRSQATMPASDERPAPAAIRRKA
jgi:hypothetical protein